MICRSNTVNGNRYVTTYIDVVLSCVTRGGGEKLLFKMAPFNSSSCCFSASRFVLALLIPSADLILYFTLFLRRRSLSS